jgi:hypothetical protein
MAVQAVLQEYISIVFLNADGFVEFARGECVAVMPAIYSLCNVFSREVVRDVAVVASCNRFVA